MNANFLDEKRVVIDGLNGHIEGWNGFIAGKEQSGIYWKPIFDKKGL